MVYKKLRIATLGPFYPFRGGISKFFQSMTTEFVKQGHEIKVFNFISQYPQIIFPGKNQFDNDYKRYSFKRERVLTPYNPITWNTTYKAITDWNPDILILKYWIPFFAPAFGYIVSKIKKKTEIKIVYNIDNIDFHEKWFFAEKLTKYALAKADCIVTMSPSVQKDAKKLLPNKKIIESFLPIYYGYNKNRYSNATAKNKLQLNDKYVLLFFGFIKKYKGLDNLIKAMPIILKDIPNAHLIIAGEVYGDDSKYFNLIEKLSLQKNVSFYNQYIRDGDVELYFKASDVLVLPYKQATQSAVLNVAYDMMLGSVATPVGSLPDIIGKPNTGIIADSINPSDIAKAVIIFSNTNKKIFMENIKKEKTKYSWDKFCKALLDVKSP